MWIKYKDTLVNTDNVANIHVSEFAIHKTEYKLEAGYSYVNGQFQSYGTPAQMLDDRLAALKAGYSVISKDYRNREIPVQMLNDIWAALQAGKQFYELQDVEESEN